MKRIRFIVTGDLERGAIVRSISRLFPHEIDDREVEWLRPRKVGAATSSRLRADAPPSRGMQAFARALLAEAWEGADGKPADLVVAVDDVELHNFDQRDVVCDRFRAALELEIQCRAFGHTTEQRVRARLRERCSFHLLCPMVESYLFGDPTALHRAGCAPDVEPVLACTDLEEFESGDPRWLPACAAIDAQQAGRANPWWCERRHAKHYLEHLVDRSGGFYDEVTGGREAFAELDWSRAANPGTLALLRALIEDMADFFGVANPIGEGVPAALTYPVRSVDRARLLLRNM